MVKGKIFTVTGAASGIGKATAIRLAQLGAAGIAISDVNVDALCDTEDSCKALGAKVRADKVDVRDASQVENWVKQTIQTFGKLDGAANVASVATRHGKHTVATLVSTAPHHIPDRHTLSFNTNANRLRIATEGMGFTMAVNLTGVLNCMQAQLGHITKPGGSIVNVSSTSGLFGSPMNAAYATSKFGVIGLAESAAGEWGRHAVRINALVPGPIDTAIVRDGEAKGLWNSKLLGDETLLVRTRQAEEVAKVLCFLLSDDASYVTGAKWTVDGGYAAAKTKMTGGPAKASG